MIRTVDSEYNTFRKSILNFLHIMDKTMNMNNKKADNVKICFILFYFILYQSVICRNNISPTAKNKTTYNKSTCIEVTLKH